MSFLDKLNKTMTLQTLTNVFDTDTGETTPTWANTTTGIACALQPRGGDKVFSDVDIYSKATHKVYAITLTVNPTTNRLIIDGNTYTILGVEDMGGRERFTKIIVERVQQ